MAYWHKRATTRATGCLSDSYLRKWNILIFSFAHPGKANRDVELRHSTRNWCRIWRRVGNESVLLGTDLTITPQALSTCLACTAYKAKKYSDHLISYSQFSGHRMISGGTQHRAINMLYEWKEIYKKYLVVNWA